MRGGGGAGASSRRVRIRPASDAPGAKAMSEPQEMTTRVSLLVRLRDDPSDQAAWCEFVDQYGRQIVRWCLRWGLSESDAEDVSQDVLVKLARVMPQFTYDAAKSYRAWLKTLTRHAWSDFISARRKPGATAGDEGLESAEAREDLVRRLEEAFDHELMDMAIERVRARVQPKTWEAFKLLAIDGASGAEVAERLGMKVATVYVHRSNVQKMIQEEIAALDHGDD